MKKINKKRNKITASLLSKISFILWAIAVSFFIFAVSLDPMPTTLSNSIFPTILFGVLAFISGSTFYFLSRADNKKLKKINFEKAEQKQVGKNNYFSLTNRILIILIFLLVASIGYIYANGEELERSSLKKEQSQILRPTPTVLQPTPTLKPVAREYIAPIPTIDPNPIINCNIHASCGGGSRQMKKSECDQTTCCQIGGKWYFYLSKEKCKQDQGANASRNYNPPTYYPPCTIYYPSLGYSQTYNYMSSAQCEQAKKNLVPVAPLPTVEPYQYSQEYLDSLEKFNKEISEPWEPSRFIAPSPTPTSCFNSSSPNYVIGGNCQ